MVKFGRHVDFFVANELDSSRQLYVVPYKEVREKCIEIQPAKVTLIPHPPADATATTATATTATTTTVYDISDSTPRITNPSSPSSCQQSPSSQDGVPTTPRPHQQTAQKSTQQQQQQSSSASGLSALFDNINLNSPKIKPAVPVATALPSNNNNNNINTNVIDNDIDNAIDNLELSPNATAPHKTAAVTLNAGTGAELAAAVRQLTNQRKASSVAIPGDYGYDDPCNTNTPTTITAAGEEKKEDDHYREVLNLEFLGDRFKSEWRMALKRAAGDFDRAMQLFWSEVFEGITSYNPNGVDEQKEDTNEYEDVIRGALPDAALQMYVSAVPPERAQETFSFLKDIHSTALINAEALRKLVKKFDKLYRKNTSLLSTILLPEVYSSNFTGSLASLEAGLALLRVLLNIEEGDDPNQNPTNPKEKQTPKEVRAEKKRLRRLATLDDDMRDVAVLSGGYFGNNQDTDAGLVHRRKEELQWLRGMIEGIDPVYIPFLVAHRGFHSIHDRSDVRPLENSLMAYEAAWTNGVHLCECDIALTKDERIILAHDENFARLGMDPASPLCNRTVRDLTFKELMNCPLKSGARPPLLFDVLRSAAAIGGDAKMIVEIKAGNTEASSALARMFLRHPQLMEHVAVVMSFDAFIMHNLRREMTAVYEQLHATQQKQQHQRQQQHHDVVAPTAPVAISSSAIRIHSDTNESNAHPMKAPVLSNIALGSTLSTSPLPIPPSLGLSHNRPSSSYVRAPSRLGGHNRLDSRDMFGLGHQLMDPSSNADLGLNLAEIDNSMSQSSTFLPIHKSPLELPRLDNNEEKVPDNDNISPSGSSPDITEDNQMNYPIQNFPKLLLITVADAPKEEYELCVDITKPDKVARLDGWLRGPDGGALDGVYMQYQKPMMGPEGSKAMRNLASRYDVGIWGANPVPDDWGTFHTLVSECHVSYVNSSLPKHFRRKMKRSMSANTLAMNGILANRSHDAL
eukprot:CAMPEP_0196132160 /NCGR_PEP_ID=MMETSP0910-20130528/1887_1 /TAXON_ID=49265 /ORGANISM="Thalassiosira rotula, Strain GSO102" /LENGTH=970 /DNA_ID=CAMNT_0041391727 /DNA_START=51 /DNA_END=2963 /DNA_ORIENTATION=-